MHIYEPRTFSVPKLESLSEQSIADHIGLYEGYVKNFNAISQKLNDYARAGTEEHAHALSELIRRRSFEFDGMRLHELYFEQFEGGAVTLSETNPLGETLKREYQGHFQEYFKAIANMRGPGWALLYYDPRAKELLAGFAGEQHQGHFATLPIILALDVWEHAFLLDHGTKGKGAYIDAFFKNLNWDVIEKRFASVR